MTADLYIRVSTEEQADNGYSQRDQEERLKKYCENNQIKVQLILFYFLNGTGLAAMRAMLTK